MFYLGIFLLSWLGVGFICGIKLIFVDRTVTPQRIDRLMEEAESPEHARFIHMASKKSNLLIMCALLGYICFIYDTIGTYRQTKADIRRFLNRNKNKK